MKLARNYISCSLIFVFFAISYTRCKPHNDKELLIMSYNVRNCLGMDNRTDYYAVADIISAVRPDVVALQELDSATLRSGGIFVLDTIAKLTGMHKLYGPAILYQGGKYGIGILSVEEPLRTELIPLPGREEQRALLIGEWEDYVVCCTHFSLTMEDRIESAKIIREIAIKFDKPVFLAGDINDTPGSDVLNLLTDDWKILSNPNMPTFRSDKPEKCIDFILGFKNSEVFIEVLYSKTGNETLASDHLPLWANISIKR